MKILVIGAGRMGYGAAFDLAHNSPEVESVTVADRRNMACRLSRVARLLPGSGALESRADQTGLRAATAKQHRRAKCRNGDSGQKPAGGK